MSRRTDVGRVDRFASAYRMLADLGYRPAAPGDGYGNIVVPLEELDLDAEAESYAHRFMAEEDTHCYRAGVTHYSFNRVAVLVLEALRLTNSGVFWGSDDTASGARLVPQLLRLAAAEYEREQRREREEER